MRVSCIQTIVSNKKYISRLQTTSANTFEIVPNVKSARKKHRYFRNECNVTYQNHICIKIFSDYTLHITGIKNINDISNVGSKLVSRMQMTPQCFGKNINIDISVSNIKILLIRSHFKYPSAINLLRFHTFIKTTHDFTSEYTECWDRFVKLGHDTDDVSIKYTVFASGSVLVSLNSKNTEKSLYESKTIFENLMRNYTTFDIDHVFDD